MNDFFDMREPESIFENNDNKLPEIHGLENLESYEIPIEQVHSDGKHSEESPAQKKMKVLYEPHDESILDEYTDK